MIKNEEGGEGEISSFSALCYSTKCYDRVPAISSVSQQQEQVPVVPVLYFG